MLDSRKRVDISAGAALNGSPRIAEGAIAASGFVDVGEASSALDLLELVAALAEELLDAPSEATIGRGAELADDHLERLTCVIDLVELGLLRVHSMERRVEQWGGERRVALL